MDIISIETELLPGSKCNREIPIEMIGISVPYCVLLEPPALCDDPPADFEASRAGRREPCPQGVLSHTPVIW